jgi:F-type H+-transporting ATPase subunit epsilon
MAKQIQLEIVTPERITFSEPVDQVSLPGVEGELGVLPGHMPLVTAIGQGELRYRQGGKLERLAVSGGFAQIQPDKVVVLAETAEIAAEIDRARAEAAVKEKTDQLKVAKLDADQAARIQASLMKELVRMKVAGRRTRG